MNWNIGNVWVVWITLGKIFQWEGAEILVSSLFYRAVIQAVLMSRSESWSISDMIMNAVEGTHVGFLLQIMGKRLMCQA